LIPEEENFDESDDSILEHGPMEVLEHDPNNEEYLEEMEEPYQEEEVEFSNESLPPEINQHFEQMPPEIQHYAYEIKLEPNDANSFDCLYCEKSFSSRSGRDTHQQIKHKCPEDFDTNNVRAHEVEMEADGKPCIVWQCPHCGHYSKKKDHHRTHLIRHAIREKEETIKQEIQETSYVMTNQEELLESAKEEVIAEEIEDPEPIQSVDEPTQSSDEPTSHPKNSKLNDCHMMVATEENLYLCSECLSKFPDEEKCNQHIQKFGSTGLCTTCVCVECSVIFPSLKLLKRHQGFHTISGIAPSLNYFDCLTCSVVFSNRDDLDAHLKLHVQTPNYQYEAEPNTKLEGCELQLEQFNEKWVGTGRLRCGYCSKIAERNDMNLHMTFFHAVLFCPFDRQNFSRSLGYFVEHLKAKHPEEFNGVELLFKCPFCVENFSSLNAMKLHCKTCEEKRFSCTHCDKKFFQERQLKQHMNLVNGVKNHNCATCNKSFANKTELNVHQRSHNNEKPYTCTFPGCNKAFRTNSHRSSHMDTHSSSENYQCSRCMRRFKTRGARRIHEKTHVEGASTCSLCLKDFRQRSHLIRHVNLGELFDFSNFIFFNST
jgi:uncharacterized Zn-finger protein